MPTNLRTYNNKFGAEKRDDKNSFVKKTRARIA